MTKKDKIFIGLITVIGLIMINIFLIPSAFRGGSFNADSASQYGSFIGGYWGPFITLLSVAFLYLTLRNQIESFKLEKTENRFFELVKLHRENVIEVSIEDRHGRKVFVSMLREFRVIYNRLNQYYQESSIMMNEIDKINIAYLTFFYGTGPNSNRVLEKSLKKYKSEIVNDIIGIFNDEEYKKHIKSKRRFYYKPFEGHQSRLGHYYRHLFQSVVYIDKRANLSEKEKYEYIKVLRAQLSTHEQALLFLNAQSDLGKRWNDEELILKYRLIKNLPDNFFDENDEINIKEIYPTLEFEWE